MPTYWKYDEPEPYSILAEQEKAWYEYELKIWVKAKMLEAIDSDYPAMLYDMQEGHNDPEWTSILPSEIEAVFVMAGLAEVKHVSTYHGLKLTQWGLDVAKLVGARNGWTHQEIAK